MHFAASVLLTQCVYLEFILMKFYKNHRTRPFVSNLVTVLCTVLLASSPVFASSLDDIDLLTQAQFLELGEELGAATNYKSVSPAENLGLIGFDVGIEVSATNVNQDLFDLASSDSVDEGQLIFGLVHLHKGLPFGIDVGASLGNAPGIEATVAGAELRYAIVQGGAVTPAVAIRATYSQLLDPEAYTLTNAGLELAVSKGFLVLTPYAGIGIVRTTIDTEDSASSLEEESFNQTKLIVGATFNFGLAWTVEAERTDDTATYIAKVGLRF